MRVCGCARALVCVLACLRERVSVTRAGIDADDDERRRIDALCAALEVCEPQVPMRDSVENNDRRLAGDTHTRARARAQR